MCENFIFMKKSFVVIFLLISITSCSEAHKNKWESLLDATNTYLHTSFWNEQTGNYVRRTDMKNSAGSDAWGITIELDAMAYMVEDGIIKAQELKDYWKSSSDLYEKTSGFLGARILARRGDQIYIGGDDEMQWSAALAHCFASTHDSIYLRQAEAAFNALIRLGFWRDSISKGWAWNSGDPRPNGVSTAYGALAAARIYQATMDSSYKKWAAVSLEALRTPQVGFFPRDMMVGASAAMTLYEVSKDRAFKERALELEASAVAGGVALLKNDGTGERNPTDIGDLADGLCYFYSVTHDDKYRSLAETFINFFVGHRSTEDITKHGFYSRYDTNGAPILTGSYLGVPCSVTFLPEVAEMQKLFAIAVKAEKKL
jgi:hypothetical protein